MSLLELSAIVFIGVMIYFAANDKPACVQMDDLTFGICRNFYEQK
jgi:hypothetical protein